MDCMTFAIHCKVSLQFFAHIVLLAIKILHKIIILFFIVSNFRVKLISFPLAKILYFIDICKLFFNKICILYTYALVWGESGRKSHPQEEKPFLKNPLYEKIALPAGGKWLFILVFVLFHILLEVDMVLHVAGDNGI